MRGFDVSPDGRWAVYWHDAVVPGVVELYSAPADGSGPERRISGVQSYPTRGSAIDFAVSPDSRTVVYLAEEESDGVLELFSVPVGGGPTTKLNSELVSGGNVTHFEISPLGDRVVYRAAQDTEFVVELYAVTIQGGPVTRLNGLLNPGGDVQSFAISPLGDRVVYRANQQDALKDELYTVPIEGGTVFKLNGALPTGGDVFSFEIGPLGARVVYSADQSIDGRREIYSVPIAGGTATKLNDSLQVSGDVFGWQISPLGDVVVYRADQQSDEVFELYAVPIGGGQTTKLSGEMTAGGDATVRMAISHDAQTLIYVADQDTDNVLELYAVPIDGGNSTKLNGALAPSGDVWEASFSPDGRWVVYSAATTLSVWPMLYRVPTTGPANSSELVSNLRHDFRSWVFDLSGPRIIVASEKFFVDGIVRPWQVPLGDHLFPDGREIVDDSAFHPEGDMTQFDFDSFVVARDGTVVYRADQDFDEEFELYAAQCWNVFEDGFESSDTSQWMVGQ